MYMMKYSRHAETPEGSYNSGRRILCVWVNTIHDPNPLPVFPGMYVAVQEGSLCTHMSWSTVLLLALPVTLYPMRMLSHAQFRHGDSRTPATIETVVDKYKA
jgi:hypothetical protein